MTRIDWSTVSDRFFETGIDRGVLYVGDNPGVPWIGLNHVNHTPTGGAAKPRYMDGVKISNHAGPEEFAATLEAFTYPTAFEVCDGTARLQNGLKAKQQRRRSFNLAYRTRVGNAINGLDHAYKLHLLYNLRAAPTEADYESLSDENEPILFSWELSSRGAYVSGLRPVSHFEIDSRDVPADLMEILENLLYGDEFSEATLPSPGELIFLFDSFEDMVYDAGTPFTPVYATYDAGSPSTPIDNTIDGGAP